MSDIRLDTQQLSYRKDINDLHPSQSCPFSNHSVNFQEINLNINFSRHTPQCSYSNPQPQIPHLRQIRAQYRVSTQCPQIMIHYRILQTSKQQKSLRNKNQNLKLKNGSSNQTKNIAKNYGKAIIAFIQRNKKIFRTVCKITSTPYQRIIEQLPQLKSNLTTVMGFRKIWTTYKYSECMRMISNIFLRKNALSYIFNSKVSNIQTHIKYRNKFLNALLSPESFDHIKDY